VKGIADTGFLVAFARSRDIHHEWAVSMAEQVTEPLLTCEAVLAETAFQLQDVGLVLEMIADGLIALSFDCNDHLPQLAALAARYKRPETGPGRPVFDPNERDISQTQCYYCRCRRLSHLSAE
jgi:hypothetical protein